MSLTFTRWHERTQRRVCLAAFLVFGLSPMLVAVGWCVARHLPGKEQAAAQVLQQQLGLGVTLEKLVYVRPGTVRYEGLVLSAPEDGRPLVRCRWVEVRRQETASRQPLWHLAADGVVVEADRLAAARRWLQYLLENRLPLNTADVRLTAAQVSLQTADGSRTLHHVSGDIRCLTFGVEAQVCFASSAAGTSEPAKVRVLRDRRTSPPTALCELSTGTHELPCRLLGIAVPPLRAFGNQAHFRGYIWGTETPTGWEGDLAGRVTKLELDALASNFLPYRLTGSGELTIQRARFQHGRLLEGSGMLVAGPGEIDRALPAAAVLYLGLQTTDPALLRSISSQPANRLLPFRQLAFGASLNAEGLRLVGQCSDAPPGTILVGENHALLTEPQPRTHPVTAVVQLLVPSGATQAASISRQGDWLLRHLPLPETGLPSLSESFPPTAKHARPEDHETRHR